MKTTLSLPHLRRALWLALSKMIVRWYRFVYKVEIGERVVISHRAFIDKGTPHKIHIGDGTRITARATILAHDHSRSLVCDTRIGQDCIIGINSIIMPGVTLGNSVVVGGGSIVTKDVPDHCMVAGNPARIIKQGVEVKDGRIINSGYRVKTEKQEEH